MPMPRKTSGKHEAQRERQRRYRRRLRSQGIPEADQVDYAVRAAVSAMLELMRLQAEDAREAVRDRRADLRLLLDLKQFGPEEAEAARRELAVPIEEATRRPEPMPPEELLGRILRGAVRLLVDRGCDPTTARLRILRRVGCGGDPAQLATLIHRSGISIHPERQRKQTSRGYAS